MLIQDLHRILLDGVAVDGLQWYFIRHAKTGQPGFTTRIPLDSVSAGFHELKIQKQIWNLSQKKMVNLKT